MKSSKFTIHAVALDAVSGGMHWQRPTPPADLLGPPNIGADGQPQWSPQAQDYFRDLERYQGGLPRTEPSSPTVEPPQQDRQPSDQAPRASDDDLWGGNGEDDLQGGQDLAADDLQPEAFEQSESDFTYEGGDYSDFE